MTHVSDSFDIVWYDLLKELYHAPHYLVSPRGQRTREILNVQLTVNQALNNILIGEARGLNYRFMVAEWLWIYFGHSRVDLLARYNPKMAQFSDDGITLRGAYGPRVGMHMNRTTGVVSTQWTRVRDLLKKDRDTREAVLVIFQPGELIDATKDVPCTLTQQFFIRNDTLHGTVNMRSSDIWLGLPYDFFVFSMLLNVMSAELGLEAGSLTFNLGSSHLYENFADSADALLELGPLSVGYLLSPQFGELPPVQLNMVLEYPQPINETQRLMPVPWALYQAVLSSKTSVEALGWLRLAANGPA